MTTSSDENSADYFLPINNFDIEKNKPSFSSRVKVDFGAISHVGKVRKNNEDAFLIFRTGRFWEKVLTNIEDSAVPDHYEENAYAMAVADGMGGLDSGEVASRTALVTVVNLMFSSVKWALKLDHPKKRDQEIREAIIRAVDYLSKADLALSRKAKEEGSHRGMGTTLTAAYSFGDDLFILHVGDSRAYVFRKGKIAQLTHDHTVAQSLADAGIIPQDQVKTHHFKHSLTRAIGLHEGEVDAEVHHLKLLDEDVILICSDGLSDMVKPDEIAAVLNASSNSQEKSKTLFDLAMEAGGKDNITVLIAHYRFQP